MTATNPEFTSISYAQLPAQSTEGQTQKPKGSLMGHVVTRLFCETTLDDTCHSLNGMLLCSELVIAIVGGALWGLYANDGSAPLHKRNAQIIFGVCLGLFVIHSCCLIPWVKQAYRDYKAGVDVQAAVIRGDIEDR